MPKATETTEAPAAEEAIVAAPARGGSSSSSSSDEEKKAKKASKSKSRSVSRGKRASIFGGLLGKKDKAEDKAEQKKEEHKTEGEASTVTPEIKKDDAPVVAPTAETSTAPVITSDLPKPVEETKTDATLPVVAAPVGESKPEEPLAKAPVEERPNQPTKRGSIFGSVFNKIRSPTSEKKEADLVPVVPVKDSVAKESEPVQESKPLEEAQVAVPATIEPVSEGTGLKTDEAKPSEKQPGSSTPTRERAHFQFGRLFSGSKDRAKSPAATDKAPISEPSKVDASAPQIEDPVAPAAVEPVVVAPVVESKTEAAPALEKKDETPKEKKGGLFAQLGRSLSKATKSSTPKESKKETATPTTVPEAAEPKEDVTTAPLVGDKKDDTPVVATSNEKTIGDVVPEAVTVGEGPKSTPAVSSTA